MILTHRDYVHRVNHGEFDHDMAQTVASWWYSPAAPAMVTFVTTGKIVPGLAEEVDDEKSCAESPEDREDLRMLANWVRERGTDPL